MFGSDLAVSFDLSQPCCGPCRARSFRMIHGARTESHGSPGRAGMLSMWRRMMKLTACCELTTKCG
jgi:hypothetical protein